METAAPPERGRAAPWAPRSALARVATILAVGLAIIAVSVVQRAAATEPAIPPWLAAHIGDGNGEIAPVVLQRARALYLQKVAAGVVRNPCYFAMDATRPNTASDGTPGLRFYIVCEASQSFRAITSGHGAGRNWRGLPNFHNGRTCAKNFGNAEGSSLTTGGAYMTAEIKASFKGYYRTGAHHNALLVRPFLQFEGEGDTANAREREIGGHAAVVLHHVCMLKDPQSPYANKDGYVPRGTLVSYVGGRSNGCTSWSRANADAIMAMTRDDPTTRLHLSGGRRHRCRGARRGGRAVAGLARALLGRRLPEDDRRAEILVGRDAGSAHRAVPPGSPAAAAKTDADLQVRRGAMPSGFRLSPG